MVNPRVVLVLVAIEALACRPPMEAGAVERRFDAFSSVNQAAFYLADRERAAAVGAAYDEAFGAEREARKLSEVNNRDLDLLYRAAQMAAFHTLDQRYIQDMMSALGELERRRLAATRHYVHAHEILIKARMFPEALALASQHPTPELESVPELREEPNLEAGRPTEWVVDPSKHELLRRSVHLSQRGQVVVVSHPLCHFSSAAMRDIQADPVLGDVFRAHARWLAPQDGRINFAVIRQWNHEHPGQETTLVFRREEWPMIDRWSTPTFYFLEDGVVKAKVEGWPKEGHRAEVVASLREVGLLP